MYEYSLRMGSFKISASGNLHVLTRTPKSSGHFDSGTKGLSQFEQCSATIVYTAVGSHPFHSRCHPLVVSWYQDSIRSILSNTKQAQLRRIQTNFILQVVRLRVGSKTCQILHTNRFHDFPDSRLVVSYGRRGHVIADFGLIGSAVAGNDEVASVEPELLVFARGVIGLEGAFCAIPFCNGAVDAKGGEIHLERM